MQLQKQLSKNSKLVVTCQLTQINNQKPYFSVTGELWCRGKMQACGCLHDDILKYYPDMKDIIELHLSDIDGLPMHAVENGYYHYQTNHTKGYDYIRCPEYARSRDTLTKDEFTIIVNSLKPMYEEQAQAAIAKYNLEVVQA